MKVTKRLVLNRLFAEMDTQRSKHSLPESWRHGHRLSTSNTHCSHNTTVSKPLERKRVLLIFLCTDLTTLLLVTASYFSASAPQLITLSMSPAFISGISCYISCLDHSVRRCGMLAVEVIAHRTGKALSFGDWEGSDPGLLWARQLRLLINARDVDADLEILEDMPLPVEQSESGLLRTEEPWKVTSSVKAKPVVLNTGYDSDDSLTGYASPESSRSASPTASELEEIERDPTLRVGVKKIPRPVYLVQLGELVRNTSGKSGEPQEEADKLEMALTSGEELIRRKQGYGVELRACRACRLVLKYSHF